MNLRPQRIQIASHTLSTLSLQSCNPVYSPLLWSRTAGLRCHTSVNGGFHLLGHPPGLLQPSALPPGSLKAYAALLHCLLVTVQTYAALCPCLLVSSHQVLHNLVESMPARVHTVIKEKGRQTRY